MGRVEGRVAIVTGAAQGIGATYARALALEGAKVVVADILPGDAVVEEIRAAGGEAISTNTDISDTQSVNAMAEAVVSAFGAVHVLVNNAALFATLPLRRFEEIPDAEWDAVMRVNVTGMFKCVRAVTPVMRQQGSGKIINVSSGTVFLGSQMLLHYVTSKAAVLGFTRSLARELGPSNICVNAIAPGLTESEGVKANPAYGEQARQRVTQARALQRPQEPADLIGPLIFLASPDSDFVTGQTLLVDGGHHVR